MIYFHTDITKPLKYISSGRFIGRENWIHAKRNIDSFVLICGLEGELYLQQDEEPYEIKPGNVLLLLPNVTHFGVKKSSENLSYYWCHFYCEQPYNVLSGDEFYQHLIRLEASKHTDRHETMTLFPCFFVLENSERVDILFNQLLHMANSKFYTHCGMDYILSLLIMELTQQSITIHQKHFEENDQSYKIVEIQEWIRINIDTRLSVMQIAEQFKYNADYLSRMFKDNTGLSLSKYIQNSKISKAKEMLIRTDATIQEVAFKLGFEDEKYFMRIFKKCENLSPTKYRHAYYYTHMNNQ